ncbi:MAG: HDOD domain-containing protein [Candidatus Melainabacteria bacterium]
METKFSSGKHEIILRRIRDIPSLPEVVNRIIELLALPNTPASRIAELISYDPGLSSKVLRMVNSAAYGFQRQISSIQHGIMILGFNTVRGLVLSASIFKMFEGQGRDQGIDHHRFWEHSLGTAMAARKLAARLRLAEADDAFSAGMLHDIGKIVLDVYFRADYQPVVTAGRRLGEGWHGDGFLQLEENTLGITHAELGYHLASKWKLPLAISEVIRYHHQPELAENCAQLVRLVAVANRMAITQYEYAGVYQAEHYPEALLEGLGLSETDITACLKGLREDMDSASELLSSIATK